MEIQKETTGTGEEGSRRSSVALYPDIEEKAMKSMADMS
jgi:hypothetical protein